MASGDPTAGMWTEALQLLEEAERMHRQFFRLGAPGAVTAWEPPVDMFEDDGEITIVVALPGVSPELVEVTHERHSVLVRAERRIPLQDRACAIQQLEIPYGYFERRIPLPAESLELAARKWADGCLILSLRKRR